MTVPRWLRLDDVDLLADRLRAIGWLAPDEALSSVTSAGNGNLNLTVRVAARNRSAILKQARPWVERYPAIAAPVERSAVEAGFYRLVHAVPTLTGFMPGLLGIDPAWHMLLIEDAGVQADPTTHYARISDDAGSQSRLIDFLVALHALDLLPQSLPCNRAMLTLNHAHIFDLPFANADRDLRDGAATLGERYLRGTGQLLHGDFFPEAWVYGPYGVQVIDPEFCLFGPPEFDLGVMAAHLLVAGGPPSTPDDLTAQYRRQGGMPVAPVLTARYAGVEIWRRLMGVAAVSVPISDDRRAALISLAAALIRR